MTISNVGAFQLKRAARERPKPEIMSVRWVPIAALLGPRLQFLGERLEPLQRRQARRTCRWVRAAGMRVTA
jgi:hypothetical protein